MTSTQATRTAASSPDEDLDLDFYFDEDEDALLEQSQRRLLKAKRDRLPRLKP